MKEKEKEIKKDLQMHPDGYISSKKINGRVYQYYQWTENGKKKSRYLKEDEIEYAESFIEERKEQKESLKKKTFSSSQYSTAVISGKNLKTLTMTVKDYTKREQFSKLESFLLVPSAGKICAIYGLRRTGKTTILFQAIQSLPYEETVYIKIRSDNIMKDLISDLEKLQKKGIKYVFIDEITLMEDFIDSASLLSDIYAFMGMKIVLSGTDSLAFWLAEGNELYDRVVMIHTTFISFKEYHLLLKKESIDEYIRYGGTLRKGDSLDYSDSSFADEESTRKYIDTSISRNIQHSLKFFKYGNSFRHLYSLYEKNELTDAINRIIEDMNHRFLLSVLENDFISHDLGISARNLLYEKNPEKRSDLLYKIDKEKVTKRLMDILEIRNQKERKTGITEDHILEIKQYLKALDLIVEIPVKAGDAHVSDREYVVFSQSGMRYAQAEALVHSLMADEIFLQSDIREREYVKERILQEIMGRMLEDMILLETRFAFKHKDFDVFKLCFARGEYDMAVFDRKKMNLRIYEIKHSREAVKDQRKHLLDEEMNQQASFRYGKIIERNVIYLGKEMKTDDGVAYLNAEKFLVNLKS